MSAGTEIELSAAAWVVLSIPLGLIIGYVLRRLG